MVEQLERGIVGPVQVIEHQHRGAHARELRREHPMGAQPRGRRPALQRELAERVGRQRERDLALVLGGTAAQHAQPVRPLGQRVEQRALADPRLTDERHGACPARADVGQRPVEELQLARPSDQLHGHARRLRPADRFPSPGQKREGTSSRKAGRDGGV